MNRQSEPSGRVVGLDIGMRRIGVAVSDELGLIAVPERVIIVPQSGNGQEQAIDAIAAYVAQAGAVRVVVGLPRNMDGTQGVQAAWTRQFADRLRSQLSLLHIPVATIDERWSTTMAERLDHERPDWLLERQWKQARNRRDVRDRVNRPQRPRGGRDRDQIDARAAAVILQSYLDRRRSRAAEGIDAGGEDA
jgi:putative Holliday junction resolvase